MKNGPLPLRLSPFPRLPFAAAGLAIGLTAIGYQLPATLEISMGTELASALGSRGFHDAESGYRWSRARSSIEFPDPGASDGVVFEVEMSGFRPRDQATPIVIFETAEGSHRTTPGRRIETFRFPVVTAGYWTSEFDTTLRSETFVPGGGDERSLGVRVHAVRLRLPGVSFPPIRQLLSAAAVSWFLVALLAQHIDRKRTFWIALVAALALGSAFGLFRLYAARVTPLFALALASVYVLDRLLPATSRFFGATARHALRALRVGLSIFGSRTTYVVLTGTALGICAAYALRSRVELDFGSPATSPRLSRFAGFDREGDRVFRESLAGGSVDLRDLGGGAPWRLSIDVSLADDRERERELVRTVPVTVGDALMSVAAASEWSSMTLETRPPPWGFRSGTVLHFMGERSAGLRISRIQIERGRSLPSGRVLAMVLVSVALIGTAFAACGLGLSFSGSAAIVFGALSAAALAKWPASASGSVHLLLAVSAAALLLSVTLVSVGRAAEGHGWPALSPAAYGLAVIGFCCWSATALSPYYVGGHFVYHTNIAEEIWNGRFWLYFFPHPDNMLGHQPQWGNVVVPHSSLYHSLASPFAALPGPWFYVGTKSFLAALLSVTSIAAGLVAARARPDGARAGTWAVLAVVAAPTGYQLLELGHLMTLFGTTMITAALAYIALEVDHLERRGSFWLGSGLLCAGFLSYTGSLLFGSAALALAAVASYLRRDLFIARRLAFMLLVAWAGALAVYYAHWVVPFVRDSLPALAGGATAEANVPWWTRVRALPEKLAYTYGSSAIAIIGLIGLGLAEKGRRRRLLLAWGAVLVIFAVVDLRFNLLLKHHYFAFPVLAIGFGLTISRVLARSGYLRWFAIPVGAALVLSGAQGALRTAWGVSDDSRESQLEARNEKS